MLGKKRVSKRAAALVRLGTASYREKNLRDNFTLPSNSNETSGESDEESGKPDKMKTQSSHSSLETQPESPNPVLDPQDERPYQEFSKMIDTLSKRKMSSTPAKDASTAALSSIDLNNNISPSKSPPKKVSRVSGSVSIGAVQQLSFSEGPEDSFYSQSSVHNNSKSPVISSQLKNPNLSCNSSRDTDPSKPGQHSSPNSIHTSGISVTSIPSSNDELNISALSDHFNESLHLEPQSSGSGALSYLAAYESEDSRDVTSAAHRSLIADMSNNSHGNNDQIEPDKLSLVSTPTLCITVNSAPQQFDFDVTSLSGQLNDSLHIQELPSGTEIIPEINIIGEVHGSEANEVLSAAGWTGGDAIILPLNEDAVTDVPVEVEVEQELNDDQEESHPKPRSRNTAQWKRNVVKALKDSGQAHKSLAGKMCEAKSLGKGCTEKCKKKCLQIVDKDTRDQIFTNFWALKNHTHQWWFISQNVKPESVKRRTVKILNAPPRRNFTNLYHLPVDGIQQQVCQKMFLDTLGINAKWIRTALMKQKKNSGAIPSDGRGKAARKAGTKQLVLEDVKKHIRSIKTVDGHYTRKNSKSKYLPECLNRRIMHKLYSIDRQAKKDARIAILKENIDTLGEVEKKDRLKAIAIIKQEPIASLRQYRDIFKTDFNLKFFKPKKDQCARCLSFKNKTPDEKTPQVIAKYQKHLSDKVIADDLKREDIQSIKNSPGIVTTCVATYDLEKVLLCPKGENSEFYYKRKLSIHNFSIFVSGSQKAFNFAWDQTEGRKGATEITTAVWLFIEEKVSEGVKEFHFYSDNCSAQNKNQFLFSMYVMASIRFGLKIIHRYLEVGHTHMEVDSVHATIEKSVKNVDIFIPSQWFTAIKVAKKTPPFYTLKTMHHDDFLDFKPVAAYQSWNQIKTSLIKEIVFDANEPGTIKFKNEYLQEFKTISVMKKSPGRPVNFKTLKLQRAYQNKIPLKPSELKDLQDLCHSSAIPAAHHEYYGVYLPSLNVLEDPPEPVELSDVSDMEDSGDEQDSSDEEAEDSSEEIENSDDEDLI